MHMHSTRPVSYTHLDVYKRQFLFHPGTVDGGKYREALQLEECEYGVVRSCARGNCLFKCGDERYNLLVKTPPHKLRCYGTAGGR